MPWTDISICSLYLLKLEAGIIASKVAGNSELETLIVASLVSLIPMLMMFGLLAILIPALKPLLNVIERFPAINKVINFFQANNNDEHPVQKRVGNFLKKKHFIFYFILCAIPFIPYLSEACIISAKVTKASTRKGYIYILAGHFVKVLLAVEIIYRFF